MEKVFTRWPSQTPHLAHGLSHERVEELPLWMIASPRNPWPGRLRAGAEAVLVTVVPSIVALAAGLTAGAGIQAGPLLEAIAALTALAAAVQVLKMRRSATLCGARYDAIFERAGISMWLEDWTAVADAVSYLRQQGITDMEAHFATRPDELRALCAKVRIKDVSAFALEEAGITDKTAVIGPLDRLLPPTDQTFVQWLVALSRGDRFFRSEAHISRPDGSVSDTLFTAPLPTDREGFADIIATSLDITAYKSEQAKLLAADAEIARVARATTVGALGASIAHEVNSPLAAVIANAQAALRWLQRPKPDVVEATEAVAAIVAEASRARDVVSRTRAFFSNADIPCAPFDIVAAARDANLLVERELRNCGTAVQLHAEPDLPMVLGDVVQTQQVLTNLLLNAAQAMASRNDARDVTVSFQRHEGYVWVEIADTGPGIDPLKLERVFDPLYSTKADGMGMGLAICRNCVDAQGGAIWASNGPAGGAVFHFTLPVHDG
jgi:C4-dicarboxylate-specific signal transduction histidine kinase